MSASRHSAVRLVSHTHTGLPVGHTEPLSAAARAYHARFAVMRATRAGLAEVAAHAAWSPPAFTTKLQQDADYLLTLTHARMVQVFNEAHPLR